MIAGLLKSSTLHSLDGLPGAQDLPIIGQLFKSKSFSRNESELLFIITPYLVDSFAEPDAVAEKSVPPVLPGSLAPPPAKTTVIPEQTGDIRPVVPASAGQEARVENAVSPLSQSFRDNLRKVYGDHALEKVGTGAGFGYIVE